MTFDFTDFERKTLKLYPKEAEASNRHKMQENGLDFEKEAKNLAPVDKGDLTGSISNKQKIAGFFRDRIEQHVGANEPYAAKVHETMAPAPDPIMRQGPLTLAKPPTEFGEAGGKYLSRPLEGKHQRWFENVAEGLRALHRGR